MTGGGRPLEGRRVLVTRAAAQAGPLAQHLRQLGAEVVEIPVITIQSVAGPDELRAAARRLRERPPPRWMAVTSANTAERLAALQLPSDLAGVRVAAVGEVTARTLRDVGVNVELVAPGTGAAALSEALLAAGAESGSVWLPQAEAARSELAGLLRSRGAEVEVTVCYRTLRLAGLERTLGPALAAGLDAVTLLSPSAADAVLAAVGSGALAGRLLICAGETTAERLRREGLSPIVAGRPDPEGVAAAVVVALRR